MRDGLHLTRGRGDRADLDERTAALARRDAHPAAAGHVCHIAVLAGRRHERSAALEVTFQTPSFVPALPPPSHGPAYGGGGGGGKSGKSGKGKKSKSK